MMILSEVHIINENNKNYKSCDKLSFLSKNLYNQALYEFRKEYEKTGKFLRYKYMERHLKDMPLEYNNYKLLTASVSQQVLMLFDKNIKSFLGLMKLWKKDKRNLTGAPKMMRFKHKTKGRNVVVIRGDIHVCKVRGGYIHFPKKLNLDPIKTIKVKEQSDLVQVRIVPKSSCYNIEVLYKQEEKVNDNTGRASIDLGVNNLASLVTENGNSYIFNGREVKSINKYYNKLKAKKQRKLMICQGEFKSKNIDKLTNKRNNKIKDQLHKISRKVVETLNENEVKELVIGYNKKWKQGIKLGKKTNQTFVSVPFQRFIDMITYKCKLEGINVVLNEESYTSKCSALDLEPLKKHPKYLGKRVKRGLFKTSDGTLINADINGALNIGRKVFGDGYINPTDIGFVLNPIKIY